MIKVHLAALALMYLTGMLQGHARAWVAWRENALPGCHLMPVWIRCIFDF